MGRKEGKRKDGFPKKLLLIVLIILLLAVIFWLLVETAIIKLPPKSTQIKIFAVQDECSIIVGKLIHTIDDEGTCQLKCRATCEVKGLQLDRVTFVQGDNQCNRCECACK